MQFENACKRFEDAVGVLVDEKNRVKERLLVAYASQLSRIDRDRDLPPAMMKEFEGLRYALSDAEMPYGYGEHAQRKLRDMSEEDASALARRIFVMFLELRDAGSLASAGEACAAR